MSTAHTSAKSCTCHECQPAPAGDCCPLPCPESPRYFCGHLLSDADLSLEQKYHRDKQQLYHRTLHGSGVVCGLQLHCDPKCDGSILLDPGFAIDDCGRDLLVCEPRSFHVIHAVEEMHECGCGSEEEEVPEDDEDASKQGQRGPDCDLKSCFQVILHHALEPLSPMTPFSLDCAPRANVCEASRLRETIRIELRSGLPKSKTWGDRLAEKLASATQVLTSGRFAGTLKDYRKAGPDTSAADLRGLFCELKRRLEDHLGGCPDDGHCSARRELQQISVSAKEENTELIRKGIELLVKFAESYVASRLLGNLVPECTAPCASSGVVIGTVEVNLTKREIVQVSNWPREYLWTLARLPETLAAVLADFFGGDRKGSGRMGLCGSTDIFVDLVGKFLGSQPDSIDRHALGSATNAPEASTPLDSLMLLLRQVASVGRQGPNYQSLFSSLRETFTTFRHQWSIFFGQSASDTSKSDAADTGGKPTPADRFTALTNTLQELEKENAELQTRIASLKPKAALDPAASEDLKRASESLAKNEQDQATVRKELDTLRPLTPKATRKKK